MTTPLAVVGPTATGKTALAVGLAQRLGAELVNADSRQVVRRLRVGTATPTERELQGVACHLLDLAEPGAAFSVADWAREARVVFAGLAARRVPAILVGGTGQYLRALREGWDFSAPPPDPAARAALDAATAQPGGLQALAAELCERDPEGASSLDLANPRRVVRAVELLRAGAPSVREARRRAGGIDIDVVVLDCEPVLHRAAIEERMESMFGNGALLAEVDGELRRGTSPASLRRSGIGYAEALEVLAGGCSVGAARAEALRRTLRYVKAQRTWFRHEASVVRVERNAAVSAAELQGLVLTALTSSRAGPR